MPADPTQAAAEAVSKYILVDMFAKACTGQATPEEAMQWATKEYAADRQEAPRLSRRLMSVWNRRARGRRAARARAAAWWTGSTTSRRWATC